MTDIKYYSAVDPSSGKPHKDYLFNGEDRFDVYHGTYNNIKSQLLGKEGVKGQTFDTQNQLVKYYRKYFRTPKIAIYDAIFGNIQVIGDQSHSQIISVSTGQSDSHDTTSGTDQTGAQLKPAVNHSDNSTNNPSYLRVAHLFQNNDAANNATSKTNIVDLFPNSSNSSKWTKWGLFGAIEKRRFVSTGRTAASGSEKGGVPKPTENYGNNENRSDNDLNNDSPFRLK